MEQERILIVDGDITLLETLETRLEAKGYLADCVCSGKKALGILNREWIDLIILGVVLQDGMGGVELFKEIRKKKKFSKIPIIVHSGKSGMKKTFEMMGAEVFFIKPYSIALFLNKVEEILRNMRKEVSMVKSVKTRLNDLAKKLKLIKAKDIMTKKVITTTEDTTLANLAELMTRKRISGLPVTNKKGKITGIISATDLFILMDMIKSGDVVEEGTASVSNPTVKFAMSSEVVKITKNTTLEEIIAIMKYKNVHTLPVFEGKKLAGVIGRHDLFKNFYAAVKGLSG